MLTTGLFSIPEGMAYAQLAGFNPTVERELKASGVLDVIGTEHIVPVTTRVLEAERTAWEISHAWLQERSTDNQEARS